MGRPPVASAPGKAPAGGKTSPPTPYRPPDQAARTRITADLESTLLVEAGAGSGKTTSLVDRMVSLVRSGTCTVDGIAAVTFTRKAAAELRERFQVKLEETLAATPPEHLEHPLIEAAIRDLDGAFLGTIHSFCAKLLRERPLEAGLDPGFREVQEAEGFRMRRKAWLEFLERLATKGDEDLRELDRLGIEPDHLEHAFGVFVENPDVDFSTADAPAPDPGEIDAVRKQFDLLVVQAHVFIGNRKPPGGWDALGKYMRTVRYRQRTLDWRNPAVFFDALATGITRTFRPTLYKWADAKEMYDFVKDFAASLNHFLETDGRAHQLLKTWWAHRYPVAVRVALRGAAAFARQRKERGEIDFQDLLVLSADLLRNDDNARRDLGSRYSRILVDEFQDTDPLQAEILMLLASDPSQGNDWRRVVPRPGALFVVGDPKQSIYRFRRADIALYDFVKRRFREIGDVLTLEANFRSLKAIERLVEGVFRHDERFGPKDTDRQASFAPLLTQPLPDREGTGLLATYGIDGNSNDLRAADDAQRVASMIARRVANEERQSGDFLVLTRTRRHLGVYARAMEDHNLPVQVSGAGVGFEDELNALFLLFRALADPADQVRVVGVLTGSLFGITLDRLVAYRDSLSGRRDRVRCFQINRKPLGEGDVADALTELHDWWRHARREPADVTIERVVSRTGLFPLAAAEMLGQLRAGALVYLMDAVRARALEGDTSLAGAVDAMETAMSWDDAEAPLVPERPNCVRIMNLHRAKGLEADVVFLAAPFGEMEWPPSQRVARDDEGRARGTLPIVIKGRYRDTVVAAPASWDKDAEIESSFERAEQVRLLYVAATRARDELWIGRAPESKRAGKGKKKKNRSPWALLEDWVNSVASGENPDDFAQRLDPEPMEPPEPDPLRPDTELERQIAEAAAAVDRRRMPTYYLETVTARAKGTVTTDATAEADTRAFRRPAVAPKVGGFAWGSVVHAVLAHAAQGTRGKALEQLAHGLLVEYERPVDDSGAPKELKSVLGLVDAVQRSEIWARAMSSTERYTEAPFAVSLSAEPDRHKPYSPLPDVVEGVIDLVFRESDGWVVADYKTDSGKDPEFLKRLPVYRAQVDLYAECWERLTGDPVCERVLVFTTQGRTESW